MSLTTGDQSKIVRHTKKQEDVTLYQDNQQEANSGVTQMLDSVDKDFTVSISLDSRI